MTSSTIHLIGNAHIDPVWLWTWTEGLAEVFATFRSALERMREYPDFTFTASSAAFYDWVAKIDPPMFAEIRQRVAEGRWHLAGGWWLEPDCNIPHGESFVRQGLYGQHFFLQHFGRTAQVGYNVDSFGHNASLPQILVKSGLSNYVFMRPQEHEKELPGRAFWWQSADGSRVLTCRLVNTYATWFTELDGHVLDCANEIVPPLEDMLCFYGVGNHGGGPTIQNIGNLHRLQNDPSLPRLTFSSLDAFFENVRQHGESLPTVAEELQHHARGCYAAHSGIKRGVRKAEHALLTAEKMSSLAAVLNGLTYPAQALETAWKQLLFNQFHDTLGGTSIPSACRQAEQQLAEVISTADRQTAFAAQSLALAVDIPPEAQTRPYIVFNPHPWPLTCAMEIEVGHLEEGSRLRDAAGRAVPIQLVQAEAEAAWRTRFCFLAELPALGYQVYRLSENGSPEPAPPPGVIHASPACIENEFIRLEIDPHSGCIASLLDKRRGVEVFAGAAAEALVMADLSDTWSHDVRGYADRAGAFGNAEVRLLESGPLRASLRAVSSYENSRLTQVFTLVAGLPQVFVHAEVDWYEQHRLLKLTFPGRLSQPGARFETAYGSVERPVNGEEECGQGWVDLSGVGGGFCLLNDGKYSFDAQGSTLCMTVLRSPVYSHHNPYQLQADIPYVYMDQGRQEFAYALLPHAEDWREIHLARRAAEFNQPPFALQAACHAGRLPLSASFAAAEPENILVSVLKQSQAGDGLILRAYETSAQPTLATIRVAALQIEIQAQFKPGEIKTFHLPRAAGGRSVETDLLERPLEAA